MDFRIETCSLKHLEDLTPLFDNYRIFYNQVSDLKGGNAFLKDRLSKNESIIYIAYLDDRPVGFTQLYPTFSSVSMESMYVFNDLFVDQSTRGKSVGSKLLLHAQAFAKSKGIKGLALATAQDNPAQFLYEKLGWEKDGDLFYFWKR